jgi:MFS family permease
LKSIQSWYVWLAAGIFYLYEFIHRFVPNVIVTELMTEFDISAATVGSLSAYYYYAYSLMQIPVGILMDKFGTRTLLTFAAFCVTSGGFMFALTTDIQVAKFSRLLIGFGSAFSFVGCLKLGSHWFSAHKFAFIVGLTSLLGAFGAMLGGKPLVVSIDAIGWRNSLLIIAVVGIFITILLYKVIQDYNLNLPIKPTKAEESATSYLQGILEIVKSKQIWLLSIFGSCMVVPIAAYSEIWGVTAIMQMHNLDRPLAAQITSFTFLGIAIGGPCIGLLSNYLQSHKIPMLFGVVGAIFSFSIIIHANNLPLIGITILHILFGFFTSCMLLCFSLCTEYIAVNARGTAIGFLNTIIMGLSAVAQPLIGWLLDKDLPNLAVSSHIIQHYNFIAALNYLIVCQLIALIALLFIREKAL